jgi:hypothetical protein
MTRKRHQHERNDDPFPIPDSGKLSQRIQILVEPFVDVFGGFSAYASLIGLACVAWNSSLADEDMRPFMVGDFVDDIAREKDGTVNRPELTSVINAIMDRKLELFPDDNREIRDYHVEEKGDKVHLRVYRVAYEDSAE